ncbi:hypothetical protein OF83DRAFT_1142529, partial [Amylostereum chailletii]
GFFTIYRNLFERLAHDERMYAGPDLELPSFGYASWTWAVPAKDRQMEAARTFYNFWLNFTTEKDFTWVEMWNVSEAPDRRVRRMMERDNKKVRDDARKDYNDTVRTLVTFLRKRDPRYKAHLARQKQSVGTASGSATPSAVWDSATPTPGPAFVAQDWQKAPDSPQASSTADLEWSRAEGEDEEWECVACGKSFRSEAAWDSHERSKKHLKAVERLRQEMEIEEDELSLGGDDAEETVGDVPAEVEDPEDDEGSQDADAHEDEGQQRTSEPSAGPLPNAVEEPGRVSPTSMGNAEGRSRAKKRSKAKKKSRPPSASPPAPAPASDAVPKTKSTGKAKRQQLHDVVDIIIGVPAATASSSAPILQEHLDPRGGEHNIGTDVPPIEPQPVEMSKRDKRRAREAAKKAREDEAAAAPQQCNVCMETFATRTKLFAHITDSGHALAEPGPASQTQKKRGKKGTR